MLIIIFLEPHGFDLIAPQIIQFVSAILSNSIRQVTRTVDKSFSDQLIFTMTKHLRSNSRFNFIDYNVDLSGTRHETFISKAKLAKRILVQNLQSKSA